MKKLIALVLALACLMTLAHCRSAPQSSSGKGKSENLTVEQMEEKFGTKVVRVLMDLPNAEAGTKSGQFIDALASLPGYGTEFTVFLEYMPDEGVDRSNVVTRIKTEIMAGKGPDLFLCGQDTYGISGITYGGSKDPFFTFPEKAMENRLFLPLDDYINKARYMEWDKLLPVVMEAGRNEEGQQIIPMAYFFPVTIVEKEKYGLEDFVCPKTRMEMVQSGNAAVRFASQIQTVDFVGRVMEPRADEPIFSEEELLEYVIEDFELGKTAFASFDNSMEEDENCHQGAFFRTKTCWDDVSVPMGEDSPNYCIIPARNVNGGVTANITAFSAINRNAKYPELAFKIIDYIMRTGSQQKTDLYAERLMGGMPVHMDVGSEEYPMENSWYMKDANFKEFEKARAEISEVKFLGPVDMAVWGIFGATDEELKKSVHEQYMLIQMLLAES